MTFKDEILSHYIDEECLVTVDRDPSGRWSTGNGLLYTGLFYSILAVTDNLSIEDVRRFARAVEPCWVYAYKGLLERNDGRPDQQAHDDYIGVVVASYLLNTYHARAVHDFGKAHCWVFDNVHPTKFSLNCWHGRFPGLVGLYRVCAKQDPGFVQEVGLATSIYANALSGKEKFGGKILTWLKVQALKHQATSCMDAVEYWERKLVKDYGSFANVLAGYFGPDHAFGRAPL